MGYGALGLKKALKPEPNQDQDNQNRRAGLWEIDYNNIKLWQVLGTGAFINEYIAYIKKRDYTRKDLALTCLFWSILFI